MFVGLPEGLQAVNGPDGAGDVCGQTGSGVGCVVCHAVFGHTAHGHVEAVRNLTDFGPCVNAIWGRVRDCKAFRLQPGLQGVRVGRIRRVDFFELFG